MIYKDPKNFLKKHFAQFDLEKNEDRLRLRRTLKENLYKSSGYERIEKEYILHYLKKTYGSPINPISFSISNSQSPKKHLFKDFYLDSLSTSRETQGIESNSAGKGRNGKSFLKNSFVRLKKEPDQVSPLSKRFLREKIEILPPGKKSTSPGEERIENDGNSQILGYRKKFIKGREQKGKFSLPNKIESFTPRIERYSKKHLLKAHSKDNVSKYPSPASRNKSSRHDIPSTLKIDESKRISVLIRAVNSEKSKKFQDFKLFKLFP
jgi:hypothetical protein